jgi:hypothetical protein
MIPEIDDDFSDGEGFAWVVVYLEQASRIFTQDESGFFRDGSVKAISSMIRANIGLFTEKEKSVLKRIAVKIFWANYLRHSGNYNNLDSFEVVKAVDYLMGMNP